MLTQSPQSRAQEGIPGNQRAGDSLVEECLEAEVLVEVFQEEVQLEAEQLQEVHQVGAVHEEVAQ